MMGKNHKGATLVMTYRATLHTSLHKLTYRHSETLSKAIIKELEQADYPMQTETFDNDLGFANYIEVAEALNVDTYFTRPYTSQDNGKGANRIGQIRMFSLKRLILV